MNGQVFRIKAGRHHDKPAKNGPMGLNLVIPLSERNGFVFALAIVHNRQANAAALETVLREHVERLAASCAQTANVEHRFEQFLSALNERLAQEARALTWDFPITNLLSVVGIVADERMLFSGTGNLSALFLHKHDSGRYQIYNLRHGIETEQSRPSWEKPFAVVLDGDLHPGDVFCVSSADIQVGIEQEDLLSILTTLPPESACAKIRQYFPHGTPVSLLIFQVPSVPSVEPARARPLSQVSIGQFQKTQSQTEKFLDHQKPSLGFGSLRQWLPFGNKRQATPLWTQPRRVWMRTLLWIPQTLWKLLRKDTRRRAIERTIETFNRLPQTTKYLLIAAIGILFIFAVSLSFSSRSQSDTQQKRVYENQRAQLERTLDQAQGAVIYQDQTQARMLYAQALSIAQALPMDTPERTQTSKDFLKQITAALDELRHVITIPEPTLVADLAQVADGVFGRSLARSGSSLFVFGSDKALYRINAQDKSLSRTAMGDADIGMAVRAASEESLLFALDDRPGITEFTAADGQLQSTGLAPAEGKRWVSITVYGDRVYALEQASAQSEGQIVRFQKENGVWSAPKNWITAKTADFSDVQDLTIDATVFVLKQNGEIARFVRGGQTGWKAQPADPPATQATRILTTAQSEFLYVLEPPLQRLLVYKKETGEFMQQYRSDAFAGLTDFLVDESAKTITILAGSRIYTINASHIQ